MDMWRTARDEGLELSQQLQAELGNLVEAELKAATARMVNHCNSQANEPKLYIGC